MSGFTGWLNSAGGAFVLFAARMVIQSSVLILILLLVDLMLRRRARAVVRYWLWLLVLARLILPPSLSSPTSLAWWLADRLPKTPAILTDASVERHRDMLASSPMPRATSTEAGAAPAAVDPAVSPDTAVPEGMNETNAHAPTAHSAGGPTWQALLLAGWLAVVAVMLVLLAQRAAFVRGLVRRSQDAPERMRDLLERCRRQMAVRRPVHLRLTSLSASPSVCGLVRPTILVPQRMLSQLNSGQLKSILLHELAHIRRADLWVNLAQTLLQIAYVYHPLVWLANSIIRKVREQAVDETVLAAMGDEAEEYPRTLLSVSKLAFDQPTLSLRLVGVVESKKTLTARIKHIVGRPFPTTARLGSAGFVLVLAIGAAIVPMAGARHDAQAAPTASGPALIRPQEAPAPVGLVVDEKGVPVAGARVLLYYRKSNRGLGNSVVEETGADAQGRFALTRPLTFENSDSTIYANHYLLAAAHPGHALAWQVIVADDERSEYRLTMTEPAAQAFRVTDREGNPLPEARVWIYAAGRNDDPNPLLRPSFRITEDIGLLTATTDKQGRATLGSLPRTSCSFNASMPGYSHRFIRLGVPPQGETHVEMIRAATVTGRIRTADGKPVAGAQIVFRADWGESYSDYAITDGTGRFLNDTMVARGGSWVDGGGSGQYKVAIRHPDYTTPELVIQLEPGQTDAFDIEAVEGTLLRVRVLEPRTERPIPGARIGASSISGSLDGYTDANGVFERRVLNGDVVASFGSPPDGVYVIEDGSGSSNVARILANGGVENVTLYAPSRLHPLVDIKGRLQRPAGSPAAGLRISTTNNITRYHTATFGGAGSAYTRTNPDGSFELKEVPRDVEVFLYAETSDHKYVLAEVLDPVQASPELARPLVMQEGRTASIILTDKSGKPRVNMALKLRPRKWEHYVFRADDRPASTDAEGRLTLDGIVPGLEYFLRDARANLSERGWWDLYNENRVLLPPEGSPAAPVTPTPTPEVAGTTIAGLVVDAAGKPISDARVGVENTDLLVLPEPKKFGSQMRKVIRDIDTRTDLQGRFHIADLNPGRTGISVWASGYRTESIPDIPTGTEDLRIVLGEPRPYQLSGVVVDDSGKGVPDAEVALIEETGSGRATAEGEPPATLRTDGAGAFRLGRILLPADAKSGSHLLFARKPGYGVTGKHLDRTGGIPSVRIVLSPEERVSGTVIDGAGEPVAGAAVAFYSCFGQRSTFWLSSAPKDLAPQAVTDANGSFTLGQLPTESDIFLQVQAEGYAPGDLRPVRTGRFGGYALQRDGGWNIMGNTGDPNAPLVIALLKVVTLRGIVVYEGTGEPAGAIRLLAQPTEHGNGSEAVTDARGRFEMTGVNPAPCNLMALLESPARDAMPEWTAAAIQLNDLKPGETRDGLRLVLTKGDIIRGRVTDSQGHPLKGIDIGLHSAARPRSGAAVQSVLTASDGTWACRFPPGEVSIHIRTDLPGASWRRKVCIYDLAAGETIENADFMLNEAVPESSRYRGTSPARGAAGIR